MPLSSLLERFRRGANGTTPGARAPSPSDVEALRTRARRRLIGMVVLVGAGVLGLPWLFETQPRPLSSDVRIVQAGQHTPGDVDAPSRAATGRVAEVPRRDAQVANIRPPVDATEPSAEARAPRAEPKPEVQPEAKPPAPKPVQKPATSDPVRPPEKPAAKPAEKSPEKAADKASQKPAAKPGDKPAEKAAEKKPDAKPDNKAGDTRYVVQFGAFADVNAARETRQKAERMGLKTYAQQVDTPQGKRIRVRLGPFADKAEADKALATLRKGGLNGNVLTL